MTECDIYDLRCSEVYAYTHGVSLLKGSISEEKSRPLKVQA